MHRHKRGGVDGEAVGIFEADASPRATSASPCASAMPPRLLREELPSGPAKGKAAELQVMLADYYEARGWTAKGDPTDAKFQELRL